MAKSQGFPSLKEFVDSISSQKFSGLLSTNLPGTRVANEDSFSDMQAHILTLYENTEALHSFVDETGAVYDCIPAEQQLSLRGSGQAIHSASDAPGYESSLSFSDEPADSLIDSPLGVDKKDRFGNVMYCPQGTIPMRRVTMDQLARFETLMDFFRKVSPATDWPTTLIEPAVVDPRRYCYGVQVRNNDGGHSYLNLWAPKVDTANLHFVSSSQHWYIGAGGPNRRQTVECGWRVAPQFYNDNRAHLFTYWTPDDYRHGCYDLTCNAFVQVPGAPIAPGMPLVPVSVVGGQQVSIELTVRHTDGRWWLFFNGTSASNAVGYYPDTIFGGGKLTTYASSIVYGGYTEGYNGAPPMGSGRFANEGLNRAAYQRSIYFYTPSAHGGQIINASLMPTQDWPDMYTAQVNRLDSPWLETLWFGGPGKESTTTTVPNVINEPGGPAADLVTAAGLVPKFINSGDWVSSQSPSGGNTVPRGTEVRMRLRTGPPL